MGFKVFGVKSHPNFSLIQQRRLWQTDFIPVEQKHFNLNASVLPSDGDLNNIMTKIKTTLFDFFYFSNATTTKCFKVSVKKKTAGGVSPAILNLAIGEKR